MKREKKRATNQRMFNNKKEDLETIIDEFFGEIGQQRPTSIPTLAPKEEKETNIKNANKLKSDTEAAKNDEAKRSLNTTITNLYLKKSLNNKKLTTKEKLKKEKRDF